jgi:hypothetical protein
MLTVNTVIDGKFYAAGDPLPFKDESAVPVSLRPFLASEAAPPSEPPTRNIYDLPLALRRQVRGLELAAAEKAWVEQQASEPLPSDVAEALQDAHDRSVSITKAQLAYNLSAVDIVHEAAAEEAEAKTIQYFVKRGGEWARVQNARLKPGEQYFAKRAGGWEYVGVINANGELPEQEIRL